MLHLRSLIGDTTCFKTVCAMRWPDGVRSPSCDRPPVPKQGHDDPQPVRQRYQCMSCDAAAMMRWTLSGAKNSGTDTV
jgi:Transposase zinc-ribbon domain